MVEDVGDGVNIWITASRIGIILAFLASAGLTYMVQFMLMVTFFSMLALINLKTTPFVYRILQVMYQQAHMKFIPSPFKNYNYEPIDDAWIWKHQLSENRAPPWLLQDANNDLFLVLFVYLLNLIFWSKRFKRWHSSLVGVRLMMFFLYWAPLVEASFRCLGQFSAVKDRQLMTWDNWVSVC